MKGPCRPRRSRSTPGIASPRRGTGAAGWDYYALCNLLAARPAAPGQLGVSLGVSGFRAPTASPGRTPEPHAARGVSSVRAASDGRSKTGPFEGTVRVHSRRGSRIRRGVTCHGAPVIVPHRLRFVGDFVGAGCDTDPAPRMRTWSP
jgi:hypothetical protein